MKVPFLDLKKVNARHEAGFRRALDDVLRSGRYITGSRLEAFENAFAAYCGARHCIGAGNGLDALILVLQALGIGEGDEVIVPANTFIASYLAISATGAVPVSADVDEETLLLPPQAVEAAITPRTKAIMPVHLFGHVCDMDALLSIAARHGLKVIEDAAQAHGARARSGGCAGTLGAAGAFSFYPGKNLGALGDGGAVVTNDGDLAARLRRLRNYGADIRYEHAEKGRNSRLDELQAAFLTVRLEALESDNEHRRRIAAYYLEHITNPLVRLPATVPGTISVWHLFAVRTDRRKEFMDHLKDAGIETLIHYPICCHRQKCYPELADVSCPVAEKAAEEIVSLPISPVMSMDQARYVTETVNAWNPRG